MASITILREPELITLLPAYTSLAQYCPIDPKVEPATWLLLENPITIMLYACMCKHSGTSFINHDSLCIIITILSIM